jgi:hypothetical protein
MTVDLKKRLAQFDRLSARRPPRSAEENEGAARPGTALNRDVAVAAAGRELGLVTRPEAGGTLWLRDHPPLPDLPAPARLPLFEGIFTRSVPPDLQAGDLLFLDTETTGLAGGTGSLVFLVGCAWWEDQGFQVQQFFLPGPGCEPPLLAALGDLAARFRAVITFNGNVFDLPLLRTRALLARRQDPCGGLESLDLLPAARRLWGRRLANCRQQTLESEVCRSPRCTSGSCRRATPPCCPTCCDTIAGTWKGWPASSSRSRRGPFPSIDIRYSGRISTYPGRMPGPTDVSAR